MSLVSESPVNSSSSDDFAAILDAELDSTSSEISPEYEEAEDDYDSDAQRYFLFSFIGCFGYKLQLSSNSDPFLCTELTSTKKTFDSFLLKS